jgi:uncharacterized membrane protein
MTSDQFKAVMDNVGLAVESAGVLVIVLGLALSTFRFLRHCLPSPEGAYHRYRVELGRSILLGLEFLVAGDIIRTVVVDPTIKGVTVLGLIVLIRTFLSIFMHLEVNGRWPWQQRVEIPAEAGPTPPPEI